MSAELKEKILRILLENSTVAVCTIDGDEPKARYLTVRVEDGLTMISATYLDSRKVGQIRKNPHTHILAGFDPATPQNPWVNLDGTAEILTDQKSKSDCWIDSFKDYFTGPEDENYVVLKFTPVRAEYHTYDMKTEVLEL